jgi:flagellar biosynthesis protein FlhG
MSRHLPLDQAQGLRRLFAHARVRFVPVVSNPHVAAAGLMLERVATAFAERGLHTLVVDAAERASEPGEMALLDLATCVETLAPSISFLAARGLPLKHVDAHGSTAAFLQALAQAAPQSRVILVHATPADLCRMFGQPAREPGAMPVCPLLLADDRPSSVTHAYAAMKLLALRAGLKAHDLLLGAAPDSPRAERIALQLAVCADNFLDAVVRDWVRLDPAEAAGQPPSAGLRRWVRERLQGRGPGNVALDGGEHDLTVAPRGDTRFASTHHGFHPAAIGA